MKSNYLIALLLSVLALGGCSQTPSSRVQQEDSPTQSTAVAENNKLGTAWGENVSSQVTQVEATRLYSHPQGLANIYYSAQSSSEGTQTIAVRLASVLMQVQTAGARNLPLYRYKNGDYSFSASEGDSYQLYFNNSSRTKTYEIVASVDGLDVISGSSASLSNSGYIVYPGDTLEIKGFRKSDSAVAAFRFAKPDDSYAANSVSGNKDNTGVIGVAVFEMKSAELPDCKPQAFPSDTGYAPAPCKKK